MSNPKKHFAPIGGTIILTIFILCVLVVILAFIDIEPLHALKTELRKQGQEIQSWGQTVFSNQQQSATATTPTTAPVQIATTAQTQTIGNWQYTLNGIQWSGSSVTLDMSIHNSGTHTVPFGFSYQVSDETFATVYKLCAQDSDKQIFWDVSQDNTGKGFYNKYFAPGETISGKLKFNVNPYSEKLYLCIAIGGNTANKLFYLGNQR